MNPIARFFAPVYVAVALAALVQLLAGCSSPQDLAITTDPQAKPLTQVTPPKDIDPLENKWCDAPYERIATVVNDTNFALEIMSFDLEPQVCTNFQKLENLRVVIYGGSIVTVRVIPPHSISMWTTSSATIPKEVIAVAAAYRPLGPSIPAVPLSTSLVIRSWKPADFKDRTKILGIAFHDSDFLPH